MFSKIKCFFNKDYSLEVTEMEIELDDNEIPFGVKYHLEQLLHCSVHNLRFEYM